MTGEPSPAPEINTTVVPAGEVKVARTSLRRVCEIFRRTFKSAMTTFAATAMFLVMEVVQDNPAGASGMATGPESFIVVVRALTDDNETPGTFNRNARSMKADTRRGKKRKMAAFLLVAPGTREPSLHTPWISEITN